MAASTGRGATVEIEGRTLTFSNLDKVLYPSGFTKAQVIDYYARIAPVMLPHLRNRPVTMVRWPDGTDKAHFFNKHLPSHTPDWVPRFTRGDVTYGVVDNLATLLYMANLAALELHVPLHHAAADDWLADRIVFDLDPGPETGIRECAQIALQIRSLVAPVSEIVRTKTSGSKGLQMYVVPAAPMPFEGQSGTTAIAKTVAEGLERAMPDRVVSKQAKELRPGKVLIDWSQNVAAKTTVAVYSLRAKEEPTVSTPVTWDEVAAAADGAPLRFTADEVLERVTTLGDLFAT
jgi:bifunctional non-homologous end joining protein LigD